MSGCKCIEQIDRDLLREYNAAIEINMFGTPRALVRLYKVDDKKRGKVPLLQASFCPSAASNMSLEIEI